MIVTINYYHNSTEGITTVNNMIVVNVIKVYKAWGQILQVKIS